LNGFEGRNYLYTMSDEILIINPTIWIIFSSSLLIIPGVIWSDVGGADPSDHQNTFDGLSMHLKSQNCHVARLVACDFPSKCQVAVPLYSLLRQFLQIQPEVSRASYLSRLNLKSNGKATWSIIYLRLSECIGEWRKVKTCSVVTVNCYSDECAQFVNSLLFFWCSLLPIYFGRGLIHVPDKSILIRCFYLLPTLPSFCKFQTADMEILAAWYSEKRNHGHPVVVIVEHMERCSVTALAELIILLRCCWGWLASVIFPESRVFCPLAL